MRSRTGVPAPKQLLGILLALAAAVSAVGAGEPPSPRPSHSSYRESAESFTWELAWEAGVPPQGEFLPERQDPSQPKLWSPSLRLSVGRSEFTFALRAQHSSQLHEVDAPQSSRLRESTRWKREVAWPEDWTRVGTWEILHLHTAKDHRDVYDLLIRGETDTQGKRTRRLLFQGVHGPPARAKKVKNTGTKK
jgi:hypothetical protein